MPKSKRPHMSCSYSDIAMAGHDSKALVYDFCAGTLI